jgi:hypothetical protein
MVAEKYLDGRSALRFAMTTMAIGLLAGKIFTFYCEMCRTTDCTATRIQHFQTAS